MRLLSHRVRQSTTTTRPGRASARKRGGEFQRVFAGPPALPPFAAMAGDALGHLGVAGLGGGEIEPFGAVASASASA